MQPYIPKKLPFNDIDYMGLFSLVTEANREIVRFSTLIDTIPNPNVLLSTLITNEAVLSSKMEGTQATLQEVVQYEENLTEKIERFSDIQEVINYRKSMLFAVDEMEKYSLSLRTIKNTHNILMDGVRGRNKDKGNFRRIQNWIGKKGSTMETATYVPPTFPEMINSLDNLEKYIHLDDKDTLIQVSIIHAQFELIHPFLDGNGRIGRVLIPLFLNFKGLISSPSFYISEYLEENRDLYLEKLNNISKKGDWNGWIEFFLIAIIEQSKSNITKVNIIINKYNDTKELIQETLHSQFFMQVVDFLFTKPIFNSKEFIEKTGIKTRTAQGYLKILEENNILESNNKARNKTYYFNDLLDIII